MIRKERILFLTIILMVAMSCVAFAGSDLDLRLYNSDIVTSDLDATFIQGIINMTDGNRIVIRNNEGFVTEKTLPSTGRGSSFRVKIPRDSIKQDRTTTFSVTVFSTEGEELDKDYIRVSYKPKKKQQINIENQEFALKMPGDGVRINANSSSGLSLQYMSSDENVAKVDDKGNVEPVGGGAAEIIVSQKNNCEYADAVKKIKVLVEALPYYTVRYHLGEVKIEDLQSNNDEDSDIQPVLIAGAYNEDVEPSDDMIAEQKIARDEPTTLLEVAEKKGEYEFLGWATSPTGYPSYFNAEEVSNLAGEGETVELYAVWHGERAQKAVEWAEELAADDRYGYGQGTSRCNICGLMPKKQYTCMPFLAAAYAHGAGDPVLFANGVHKMYLNDKNFRGDYGTVWEKIDLCKNLTIDDLRPGDVIIKWSDNDDSGHAWMYAGDDLIVEAAPSGSYANQIAVKEGAAAKLRRYGSSEGIPSKNYVMRYRF